MKIINAEWIPEFLNTDQMGAKVEASWNIFVLMKMLISCTLLP